MIEREDIKPMIAAAGIAAITGFGVPVGANLLYIWQKNPLVKKYRSTLSYQSALWGDGLLLPAVNALMARSLRRSGVREDEIAKALAIGATLTTAAHVYQASSNGVNWQMPTPWHWTALGYEHALHMTGEVSFLSLYFTKAIGRLRRKQAVDKRELALAVAGVVGFLTMLFLDYQE
jgi:hypothetical protein